MNDDVTAEPVVTTSRGAVIGAADAGIHRYLGVPYALPPFGPRRFALPVPVPAWEGVRFLRTGDPGWPTFGAAREVQVYDTPARVAALPRAGALDALPR